jgi:hypothetical protein
MKNQIDGWSDAFFSSESNSSLKVVRRVVSWRLRILPAVDRCLKPRCQSLHQFSVEDSPGGQAMNQEQWIRGEVFTMLGFDGGRFRRSVHSYAGA